MTDEKTLAELERQMAALREKLGPLLAGIAKADVCITNCMRFNGVIITPGIIHDLLRPADAADCLKLLNHEPPSGQKGGAS